MALNYKIKSNLRQIEEDQSETPLPCNVAGQSVPSEAVYLTTLDIESEADAVDLAEKVANESLSILLNDLELTTIEARFVALRYASYLLEEDTKVDLLRKDVNAKKKVKEAKIRGEEYIAEAELYTVRREKGQRMVDVEMAILVTEKFKGSITEAQSVRLGELGLAGLLEANAGQWKSAYKTLSDVVNDANFINEDQIVKDYITGYRDTILANIPLLYPNG